MMEEYKFSIDVTKLLNVLERIANAIEEQTEKLSEIDWTIGQISDRLEISTNGRNGSDGQNIADVLSFCNNREEVETIAYRCRDIAEQCSHIKEGLEAE